MSFGMVAASYLGVVDTPTPILTIAFDEGSGNAFSPTIGPGTGMVESTYGQWIPGVHGGTALGRNGTAGPVDNPTRLTGLSSLNTSSWTGLTVMAWVMAHEMTEGVRRPLYLSQGTTDTMMAWIIPSNSTRPQSYLKDAYSALAPEGSIPDNTWSHLCTTWDGTQQVFYVNGLDPVVTPVTGPLQDIDTVYIGSTFFSNIGAYGVDDLRIYDTALTQVQIATLMSAAV